MLLLSGVLLLCGAAIALVWAYEVNRRQPKPRWAQVEMIWETLLATVIGVAMVGILLAVKYTLRLDAPASLAPGDLLAAVAAVAATAVVAWYLLRPLRASRLAAAARAEAGGPTAQGPKKEGPTGPAGGAGARAGTTRRKAA